MIIEPVIRFSIAAILIFSLAKQADATYSLSQLLYDESYILDNLDDRFPFLKLPNGSYKAPRDHFNFSHVFQPTVEYLNSVNIEELLFDELRAMEFSNSIATMDQWHYSDETELLESGRPDANEEQCSRELNYIDQKLASSGNNSELLFTKGLDNIRFLQYLDSWGRPPSETHHGHSYWVGSYRACNLAQIQALGENQMRFRYCWGKLRAKSWPRTDEMIPPTSVRVGLCLPKSCDTRMANQQHKEIIHRIMSFNFSPMLRDRYHEFIDIYCLPNRDDMPPKAQLFLLLVGLWIIFLLSLSLLAATPFTSRFLSKFLQSMTLQANYRKLVSDDPPRDLQADSTGAMETRVDLRALSIVKLFGSIAVCIGHTGCSFGWLVNSSSFSIIGYRELTYHMMPSLLKSMDLFMVIGGLLTAFTILTKFTGHRIGLLKKPKVWLALLMVRYLRLAPMLILVLYFMKALYPSLSDGPMWDYGTYQYSMQGQCQRSSWLRLLVLPILYGFRGNYYVSECLPVSWYLITDFKIAFVAPVFIYLFYTLKGKQKWSVLGLVVLFSSLWQYYAYSAQKLIYFQQFFTYGQLLAINILSLSFGETGYFNPINRSYAFAIGAFAGTYLYYYHTSPNGKRQFKWPFWMRGYWLGALILWEVYDFFSPHMAQYNYLKTGNIPSEETIKLVMIIKPRIDAIIFAVVILRLTSDLAPGVMRNTMLLYKLSKLSYCVYLVHAIIISYIVSSNEWSRPESYLSQLMLLITSVVVMSFMVSFVLFLLFEWPFVQIVTKLIPHKQKDVNAGGDISSRDATRTGNISSRLDGKED